MGIACDISEEPQHEATKNPEQGTLKHRRRSSPGGARIPGRHNCQKHGGTAPDLGRCTRSGPLHPIWAAAPDRGRCTRTEEVYCLRIGRSAPTHKNKRGTGKPSDFPPTSNPSTGHRARNDNPVSAGNDPSPRPRCPRYRSECPARRYGHPRCRLPDPCR